MNAYGLPSFLSGREYWTCRRFQYLPMFKLLGETKIAYPELGTNPNLRVTFNNMSSASITDPMRMFSTSGSDANAFARDRMRWFVNGAGSEIQFKYSEDVWGASICVIACFLVLFPCDDVMFYPLARELCNVVARLSGLNPIDAYADFSGAMPSYWSGRAGPKNMAQKPLIWALMNEAIRARYVKVTVHRGYDATFGVNRTVYLPIAFNNVINNSPDSRLDTYSHREYAIATVMEVYRQMYGTFFNHLCTFMNSASGRGRTVAYDSQPFMKSSLAVSEFGFWCAVKVTVLEHIHCAPAGNYPVMLDTVSISTNPTSIFIFGTNVGVEADGSTSVRFRGYTAPDYRVALDAITDYFVIETFLRCVHYVYAFHRLATGSPHMWFRAAYLIFRQIIGLSDEKYMTSETVLSKPTTRMGYLNAGEAIPAGMKPFHEMFKFSMELILNQVDVQELTPTLFPLFPYFGGLPMYACALAPILWVAPTIYDWVSVPSQGVFVPIGGSAMGNVYNASYISSLHNVPSGPIDPLSLPMLIAGYKSGNSRVGRPPDNDVGLECPVWVNRPTVLEDAATASADKIVTLGEVMLLGSDSNKGYDFKSTTITLSVSPGRSNRPPSASSQIAIGNRGQLLSPLCAVKVTLSSDQLSVHLIDMMQTIFSTSFRSGLYLRSYPVGISDVRYVVPDIKRYGTTAVFS